MKSTHKMSVGLYIAVELEKRGLYIDFDIMGDSTLVELNGQNQFTEQSFLLY